MFKAFALSLSSFFLAPAFALACSGPAPISYNPLNFLAFGVAAGAFHRLFLERLVDGSEEFHSAIYLSFLIASLGAGVIVSGELSFEPNGFHGVLAALAALGSLRPKSGFWSAMILVPVFCLSAWCAMFTFAAQDLHKCNFDANPVATEIRF